MLRTITVADLIELLQHEDPDMPVVFASNYGDISHTEQAHALRGRVEEVVLVASAYSDSGYAVADADDEAQDDTVMLVLR